LPLPDAPASTISAWRGRLISISGCLLSAIGSPQTPAAGPAATGCLLL
jgi:hypothetical protein